MKTIFALLLLSFVHTSLHAQDATDALPSPSVSGSPEANPGALIPEPPPLIPKSSTSARGNGSISPEQAFKKSKTGVAVTDIDQKIRFRKAETQALTDPRFQQLKEEAEAARTPREKRELLTDYYTQLFARITKIDNSLKTEVELRKKVALGRFDQSKMRDLGETPSAIVEQE